MHHNHPTRPPHIRHHIGHHQGPMHHPPPNRMNMGPQIGPPQHHMQNVPPPHGPNAPTGQYIPPHQRGDMTRFSHHNQPRLPHPMHQQSIQSKVRAPSGHHNGLLTTSIPPPSSQQHQKHHQQQGAINHPGNIGKQQIPAKHHVPSLQNKLNFLAKKPIPQNLSLPPPSLVQSKPPQLGSKPELPKTPPSQQSTPNASKHVSILSKHPPPIPHLSISQPLPPSLPQSSISTSIPPPSTSTSIPSPSPTILNPSLQSIQQQSHHQQQQQNTQVNQKQHVIQPQQQQHHKLPSQSLSNQTTISSTTNSVLVSITHQQTQQTVVVQQQTRQGQSHDALQSSDQITQSSPTNNNKNINIGLVSNENSTELIRGTTLPSLSNETLANSKEKTPMCLVNELARYNKIQHQYRLTGEQGPAHSKRFTVTLRLGDEEYTSDGLSIKKAQHLAAGDAISRTKYQHPPAKSNRLKSIIKPGLGNITPTVELNALAMKLGEPTLYVMDNQQAIDANVRKNSAGPPAQHQILPSQPAPTGISTQSNQVLMQLNHPNYFPENHFANFNRNNPPPNGVYNAQRFPSYARRPFVKGPLKFAPSSRIIPNCNNMNVPSVPREPCRITLVVGMRKFIGIGGTLQAARHDAATRALEVLKPLVSEEPPESSNDSTDDSSSDLKSPISLVHEIALKRNLVVTFDVTNERGPPHMKTFLTICRVGTFVTEGEGNGKKTSKKRAAENMLEELRKLPPVSPARSVQAVAKMKNFTKRKPQPIKRKTRNIIKEQAEPEIVEEVNPISKLIQIQQALKEREPAYTVIEERGAPRRREFVMEVSVSGHSARGTGSNKKMAKRLAAENLLTLLGVTTPTTNGKKDANANKLITNNNNVDSSSEKTPHRVKFQENVDNKSADGSNNQGRQIVPGILLMQQKPPSALKAATTNGVKKDGNESMATEKNVTAGFASDGVRPKDQLLYLGHLLGFQVQYSDYPKGNHGAYLSIVTLTTDPPQLCHGAGNKIEDSQDEASLTALKLLSELGLDNVKPKKSSPEEIKV